jgi:hypothetical protein
VDATGITALSALLMAGGVVLLALLALAVLTDRPRIPRPDPVRLRAAAVELAAHAVAIQTEAGRAAAIATEARQVLEAAQRERDEAWAAQEAAEQDYDRAWQAVFAGREAEGGAPAPDSTDAVERDRAVSRAALAAYRRGDISVQELREVFRRTGDWDPFQEQRERVLEHGRMRQAAARRAYDRAAAVVRRAEQEAWTAESTARELLDEVAESVAEAHEAFLAARRNTRGRRPRKRLRGTG